MLGVVQGRRRDTVDGLCRLRGWPGYGTARARTMREVAYVSAGLAYGEYTRQGKLQIAGENQESKAEAVVGTSDGLFFDETRNQGKERLRLLAFVWKTGLVRLLVSSSGTRRQRATQDQQVYSDEVQRKLRNHTGTGVQGINGYTVSR